MKRFGHTRAGCGQVKKSGLPVGYSGPAKDAAYKPTDREPKALGSRREEAGCPTGDVLPPIIFVKVPRAQRAKAEAVEEALVGHATPKTVANSVDTTQRRKSHDLKLREQAKKLGLKPGSTRWRAYVLGTKARMAKQKRSRYPAGERGGNA
jgi:hypothetical protein